MTNDKAADLQYCNTEFANCGNCPSGEPTKQIVQHRDIKYEILIYQKNGFTVYLALNI